MDPSGAGTCGQIQHTINDSKAKGPPFTVNTSQQALRTPVAQDANSDLVPDCGLRPSNAEVCENKAEDSTAKSKEQKGWRKVVRNFTPS